MIEINLREYAATEHGLSVAQRDALLREAATLGLSLEPVLDADGLYRLTAGPRVGAMEIGGLSILIEPKIGIPQLLSLACYAMGAFRSQEERLFDFEESAALPDTLAIALVAAARRAFSRGLLHGYRQEEDALQTVRGRILVEQQLRCRLGVGLPVEVRYDEFTDDILANRLVKAAAGQLGRMRLRSLEARRGVGWVAGMLEHVSPIEYPPGDVPPVRFDRLNEHYRDVVGLARLILRHSAFESGRGDVRAFGFLMNMNVVFQEFVTVALREALGVSELTLRSDRCVRGVTLDEEETVGLEPDLSWWDGPDCAFVGDAKYKNLTGTSVPTADLYQLLAYVTALDLPAGLLVYAQGEADAASYRVRHAGKRLHVAALDLSGALDDVLRRVDDLAARVLRLRDEACGIQRAA
ncbi:MAG: restriction endonuclease [Chloroflexi bacterium]|nr:restriction endonuclease [Chloroflexota bacterium]